MFDHGNEYQFAGTVVGLVITLCITTLQLQVANGPGGLSAAVAFLGVVMF